MSKPATLPVWATTDGTTVAPSGGQQAAGFAVGTKPPARWVNWLFNWICQWLAYLSAGILTQGAGTNRVGAPGSKQTFTSGTAQTYTTPSGVSAILVRAWGGGGAGGGVGDTSSSKAAAGSGGNSGGYAERLIVSPDATYTYTVGAGGSGVAGSNGNNGAASTFGAGLTAVGGYGGNAMTPTAGLAICGPSTAVIGFAAGDITGGPQNGGTGIVITAGGGGSRSGDGGSSLAGTGGGGGTSTGGNASGHGAGGGGSGNSNSASTLAGGNGSGGLIEVIEYY